jgi:hypothetical protein
MGALRTNWPCQQQRRLRRDWSSPSAAPEPIRVYYDPQRRHLRTYSDHLVGREVDRQRKGLLSTIARLLVEEEPAIEQPEVRVSEDRFYELVARWRSETRSLSSTTDRALNSAYQDIIGMGKPVLPLLFRELDQHGGHWFWALRHITRENPVPQQDAGNIQKMREAWLRWGREHNYL